MARRSVLFSPGDRPELLRKAPGTGADTVVLDLEDAVAPARKSEAREAVREVLADPEFDPDCEVCVRVNPRPRLTAEDVRVVFGGTEDLRADAVMLPKAKGAADVEWLVDLLADHGWELPAFVLVESARGILNAEAIADADPVTALAFGAEDLSADVGATRTDEGAEVLYAREHVILAAAAAGVDAIDTIYTDIDDSDGLAEETAFALDLGYDGKMVIHPSQVPVVNDSFTPSREKIEWARKVLDARDEADEEGRGVFRVDDEMVDAPLIEQAERVMEHARAADVVE